MEPKDKRTAILIVEDDLKVALACEDIVAANGFKCLGVVQTAKCAADLASKADIALVDINLGEEESGTMIGEMLSTKFGVSVIFLTGSPDVVAHGFDGAVGFITKPASEATIVSALDYAVARRRGEKPSPPLNLVGFA